jgi:isopentenyl-diphosphate delta-isomerase
VAEDTRKRKADHIRISLNEKAQAQKATSGFEDVQFVHNALPEINRREIDLSTHVFDHKFSAPIIVGAMTGGTLEAEKINATIAQAVENLQLGMGVGSQRAALQDPKLAKTFAIARKKAPTAFLIANIGGVQLVHGYELKEIKRAIEMIDADAIAIHLNPLQEAIQPEGETNFQGILSRIIEISREIEIPIIIKETGAGFASEPARKLEAAGVKGIDIGGVGGTSFAAVEYYRAREEKNEVQQFLGETFREWGIPTVISLAEVTQTVSIPVIASGGLRSGIDIAKALALGASLTSLSQPILRTAVEGLTETENLLSLLTAELKNVMFLVGAINIEQLAETPVVITGKTAEWLRKRGFNTESFAKRRAK